MGLGIFLLMVKIILLCFLAYFGAGYGCIRLYEVLTFSVPFSRELVSGGVYNSATHRKLMHQQATPLAVLLAVSVLLIVLLAIFTPAGFPAAIACFAAGIIIYYRSRQGKKAMIRRFVRQYRRHMDEGRLHTLLQEHYHMSMEEPAVHAGSAQA